MNEASLYSSMHELLLHTCTRLPDDITRAIARAEQLEDPGTIARETLSIIRESAARSLATTTPICQDTGTIFARIDAPPDSNLPRIAGAIRHAVRDLTASGLLRQNCVDPLTETNTGTNLGPRAPQIHFHPADGPAHIALMLKGGGSENVSTQYSLPDENLDASRNFEGVRRCLLDAVWQAQGKGCAPGILGVCIGGDRATGYISAKEQLFRHLDQSNPDPALQALEETVLEQANSLDIGPMGLGGKTTLLGVSIGHAGRHPACYYVTLSYSCWATRRYIVELAGDGSIARWT